MGIWVPKDNVAQLSWVSPNPNFPANLFHQIQSTALSSALDLNARIMLGAHKIHVQFHLDMKNSPLGRFGQC